MNCKKCGEILEDNALFCTNCGEKTVSEVNNEQAKADFRENADYNANNGYQQNNNTGAPFGSMNNNPGPDGDFYSAPQPPYGQNVPPYPNDGGNWYPPVNDKAATVKDYLKWMLLYPLWSLIPGIGFIIYLVVCFKFAFDETFKARANFFKAVLICTAVSVCFAVLICIIMFSVIGSLVATEFDTFSEMYPELYEEFTYNYDLLKIMFVR